MIFSSTARPRKHWVGRPTRLSTSYSLSLHHTITPDGCPVLGDSRRVYISPTDMLPVTGSWRVHNGLIVSHRWAIGSTSITYLPLIHSINIPLMFRRRYQIKNNVAEMALLAEVAENFRHRRHFRHAIIFLFAKQQIHIIVSIRTNYADLPCRLIALSHSFPRTSFLLSLTPFHCVREWILKKVFVRINWYSYLINESNVTTLSSTASTDGISR